MQKRGGRACILHTVLEPILKMGAGLASETHTSPVLNFYIFFFFTITFNPTGGLEHAIACNIVQQYTGILEVSYYTLVYGRM